MLDYLSKIEMRLIISPLLEPYIGDRMNSGALAMFVSLLLETNNIGYSLGLDVGLKYPE